MFFEIVETGLEERFQQKDIQRIYKFCQYASGRIPKPMPMVDMHE